MLRPVRPPDEAQRQKSLEDLNLLDTPAEERFERITRLACQALEAPIAAITLIDQDRQWFKSIRGLDHVETARDISFCAHTILQDDVFTVSDARTDPRFADNPLVTGETNIGFYMAHPLHAPDGSKIGSVCIIDHRPREVTPDHVQAVRDLAALAETELNLARLSQTQQQLIEELDSAKRQALLDPLTQLWNRRGLMSILSRELDRARRTGAPLGIIMADLDRFKLINDTHGHVVGDTVLREAANRMLQAVRPYDALARYGGEEFAVVVAHGDPASVHLVAQRVHARIGEAAITAGTTAIPITVSLGVVSAIPQPEDSLETLIESADAALYQAKLAGRNRIQVATRNR